MTERMLDDPHRDVVRSGCRRGTAPRPGPGRDRRWRRDRLIDRVPPRRPRDHRRRGARTTSDRVRDLVARGRARRPRPRLAPDDPAGRLRRGRLPRARDETGVDVHFRPTGSLTLAENEGRMTELRYAAAIARHHGIEARLLNRTRSRRSGRSRSPTGSSAGCSSPATGP